MPLATATSTSVAATSPTATQAVPPSTTGPVVDIQAGQQVFIVSGCVACHTVSTVPGAVGTVGPVLDGLASRAGARKAGLSAEGYIQESIENPGSFVVQGFINLMPSQRGTMTDGQFGNLVAFLLTLK